MDQPKCQAFAGDEEDEVDLADWNNVVATLERNRKLAKPYHFTATELGILTGAFLVAGLLAGMFIAVQLLFR